VINDKPTWIFCEHRQAAQTGCPSPSPAIATSPRGDPRANVPADRHFLQFPHGRYSESLLRRDKETIANLYESNGFPRCQVNLAPEVTERGKLNTIAVFLNIEEGPQYWSITCNRWRDQAR